ncbi:hypothetical protein Taro_036141 [Colocasia esculenta]|uniref:RNA helicase n=1 Tax=Colocasia esculenta TaxID=4460 RepID=A0A843WCI2_COLES|nr:hypothetical protein [Colocasia esculenta]
MAADSGTTSLGPRFAPDDPTLEKPWKAVIDGTTGLLYYWNPETNVTQYERPAVTPPPPLPSGAPQAVAMPKLAPLPVARAPQPNGAVSQPSQQILQQSSYQMPPQQPGQPIPNSQAGPQFSYQQASQQMIQQQGPQVLHLQSSEQMQMSNTQPQQYPRIQVQQMSQQPNPYPQPQLVSSQQGHQSLGLQMGQQQSRQQLGFSGMEEVGLQQAKQIGFSSMQFQPTGSVSSDQNLSAGGPRAQLLQVGAHPSLLQQHSGRLSTVDGQQTPSSSIRPQSGFDNIHRQQHMGVGTPTPDQAGTGLGHNLMPVGPSSGVKIGYEEDQHRKMGNDFYVNNSKDVQMMPSQQPKLHVIPQGQHQQDMRISAMTSQMVRPERAGGVNMALSHGVSSMYGHSFPGPVPPNGAAMRPSFATPGADFPNLSAADVYRKEHEVTAMGDNVPAPFMTFETTGFPPEILREMHFAGFSSPTPIQAQTWPVALQGRDIVAIARTGSGKTLGYLIPAFIHLQQCRNNPQVGPTVLVLAPTRELATQIQNEARKFGRSSRVSCTCLYGGAPKGPQLREIENGADIVVATPGRLNDILDMGKINFCQVSFLVLDEADRMLDMGFEPQIRRIVNEISPRRQTLMYTATWPKEVRNIAGDLLTNPVQVNIGSDELAANKSITQVDGTTCIFKERGRMYKYRWAKIHPKGSLPPAPIQTAKTKMYVEVVPPMEKQRRLEEILRAQDQGSKIIIFCSTKKQCDQLVRSIGRNFGAAALHGDKSQGERDWVLNQFRSGRSPILVATDVAARGLDIKDIRVVINYDFPTGIEDYVHRIGRTGRAGATGISYTFFSDQDWKYASDLIKVLEGANQRVPSEVREMAARGGPVFSKGRGGMGRWESSGGRWDSGRGRGMLESGGGGGFGGRGGRSDFFGGRGGRGRGFGGPGGPGGRGRFDRGPYDRYSSMNRRGRQDNRGGFGERNRDRSFSRSPARVLARGYNRSRSRSQNSRSWSRSRSRSRSWSRSRSYSRSQSRSQSRSRSHSYDGPQGRNRNLVPGAAPRRPSGFDVPPQSGLDIPQSELAVAPQAVLEEPSEAGFMVSSHPRLDVRPHPGLDAPLAPGCDVGSESGVGPPAVSGHEAPVVSGYDSLSREMSPMSPGTDNRSFSTAEQEEVPVPGGGVGSKNKDVS